MDKQFWTRVFLQTLLCSGLVIAFLICVLYGAQSACTKGKLFYVQGRVFPVCIVPCDKPADVNYYVNIDDTVNVTDGKLTFKNGYVAPAPLTNR